jgi:SHS family lactate transporter-like MFS transporter
MDPIMTRQEDQPAILLIERRSAISANRESRDTYRSAFFVGFAGWTLDAVDFFLVVFLLTTIGREFHQRDAIVALSLTATIACRPLGGFVFGLLADRYGRKLPLILNLGLYAAVQIFTAMAPTFTAFLISRAIFGTVMGGQWGVGTSFAMETVPTRLRGVLSGVLQQGYAVGYLFAGLAYSLGNGRLSWRTLFALTALPAIFTAVFLALYVRESTVWERSAQQSWRQLGKSLLANWKLFAFLTIFMMTMHMASHGTQDMYPTFLERQWDFGSWQKTLITAVAMVGAIIGGVTTGFLSDRFGRRRSILYVLLTGVTLIPLWAFAPSVILLFTGAFLLQFCVQGAWGVVPAYVSELSPDTVRAFIPGFANQCGVVLASSVVYFEARAAHTISYSHAMAVSAAAVFLFAITVTAFGPEQRSRV